MDKSNTVTVLKYLPKSFQELTTKNPFTFFVFLGTRFREGLDFGFVYLDIMHVYPEDAGTYTLKATNVLGQAVNSANLNVR